MSEEVPNADTAASLAQHLHEAHGWGIPLAPLKSLKRLHQEHVIEHTNCPQHMRRMNELDN